MWRRSSPSRNLLAPAGTTPPNILVYNASSVPVLDLQVSDPNMTSTDIYDLASNFIRPALVSVPGVSIPTPYGGAPSYVEIDLNQSALLANGLSAQDVAHALANQNIVLPAGDEKIAALDYFVSTNASPLNVADFNTLPIRKVGNDIVTLGDVAHVHRGGPPQTNMVLVKGKQSVLIEILKSGNASTLAVVAGVKKMIRSHPAWAAAKEAHLNRSGFSRCISRRFLSSSTPSSVKAMMASSPIP